MYEMLRRMMEAQLILRAGFKCKLNQTMVEFARGAAAREFFNAEQKINIDRASSNLSVNVIYLGD